MIFEIVAILYARKWPFLSYFPSKINLGTIKGDILVNDCCLMLWMVTNCMATWINSRNSKAWRVSCLQIHYKGVHKSNYKERLVWWKQTALCSLTAKVWIIYNEDTSHSKAILNLNPYRTRSNEQKVLFRVTCDYFYSKKMY